MCVCARTHTRRCSAATAAKEAAEILEPIVAEVTQKFHSETTPASCAGTGHNPPSSRYQKGLNRTIAVTELFGDSSTMCPKQVGNKRDEESVFFSPTELHCAPPSLWQRKKALLLQTSWLLSFSITGKMLRSQSTHGFDDEEKHLCDGFKSTVCEKKKIQ